MYLKIDFRILKLRKVFLQFQVQVIYPFIQLINQPYSQDCFANLPRSYNTNQKRNL
jgi:hypothetical protein